MIKKKNVFNAPKFTDLVTEFIHAHAEVEQGKLKRTRLKNEIIATMKRHNMKKFENETGSIRLQAGSTRHFRGGYKAFIKSFGREVADRWFKCTDYEKLVVKE